MFVHTPLILELLGMGAGRPLISIPGPGWYASDDGLVEAWSAPHRVFFGESREYWMNFEPMGELLAGDVLDTIAVTVDPPAGLGSRDERKDGKRVLVDLFGSNVEGEYRVRFLVHTIGGSVLVRSGPVVVESLGDDHPVALGVTGMALVATVGWYASNDGLVNSFAQPHRKDPAETRRYFMDFTPIAEIQGGDTITGTPDVAGAGLTFTNIGVVDNRVEVNIAGGTVNTEYLVVFTIATTAGSTVKRGGKLRVASL